MAITDDRTTNRSYLKPSSANDLQDDVVRIRGALDAIDADVHQAVNASGSAEASAAAATAAASAANGQAQAARQLVGVTATDTTPGGLQGKIEAVSPIQEEVTDPNGDARLRIKIQDASITQKGAVRLANETESTTGSADNLAVTPAGMKAAISASSGSSRVPRSARTSNTKLVGGDRGNLIDITSGTFVQTFDPAASLGAGWWCYIRNAGSGDVTLQAAASEQIDGLASYVMYPGEVRLLQCDGTTLRSIVLVAFIKLFTSSTTFVRAPGYTHFDVELLGGGGGGAGGGTKKTGAEDVFGGGAGAGGAYFHRRIAAALVGTTETVTIGAGGAAGNGAASGSNLDRGALGAAGGTTSFGAHAEAAGGNGGQPGTAAGSANGGAGGSALPGTSDAMMAGQAGITNTAPTTVPWWGGAAGGKSGDRGGAPAAGGRSAFGGAGGGGGGGADPTNGSWTTSGTGVVPPWAGAQGGTRWTSGTTFTGGGANGGSANNSSSGDAGNGSNGTTPTDTMHGTGGGGGGAGGRQGGDGGAGGRGAGGGGGGSGFNGRGGHGGLGGNGAARVVGLH